MPPEPSVKRTIAFFDGQNLYHHAKAAFGYSYPNYSPLALASQVCRRNGFNLHEIRFYTGIPSKSDAPAWNAFWSAKLLAMSRERIVTFSRPLRYRRKEIKISGGVELATTIAEENCGRERH